MQVNILFCLKTQNLYFTLQVHQMPSFFYFLLFNVYIMNHSDDFYFNSVMSRIPLKDGNTLINN